MTSEWKNLLSLAGNGLGQRMDKLENRMDKLESRVEAVEIRQIRFENEIVPKVNALLDGYHQNNELLMRHSEQLERIEEKVTVHDIQISILDKTKSNKRRVRVKETG